MYVSLGVVSSEKAAFIAAFRGSAPRRQASVSAARFAVVAVLGPLDRDRDEYAIKFHCAQ